MAKLTTEERNMLARARLRQSKQADLVGAAILLTIIIWAVLYIGVLLMRLS